MASIEKTYRPNLLERAIAAVAPSYALSRASAKTKLTMFGYDGATPGTLRQIGTSFGNASPEDWRTNRDRKNLMFETRDLEKNSCLVKGTLDNIMLYCMGRLSYQAQTGDAATDKIYQDYFHNWSKRCDVTKRHTFRQMVSLALRNYASATILAYYFYHVDGKGDAANIIAWLRAIESGTPHMEAAAKHLIRGQKLSDIEKEIARAMQKEGLVIEFTGDAAPAGSTSDSAGKS